MSFRGKTKAFFLWIYLSMKNGISQIDTGPILRKGSFDNVCWFYFVLVRTIVIGEDTKKFWSPSSERRLWTIKCIGIYVLISLLSTKMDMGAIVLDGEYWENKILLQLQSPKRCSTNKRNRTKTWTAVEL